jgi:hypothetical protein
VAVAKKQHEYQLHKFFTSTILTIIILYCYTQLPPMSRGEKLDFTTATVTLSLRSIKLKRKTVQFETKI